MGNTYYNNAKYTESLPYYQNSVKLEPAWKTAHLYLGDNYRLLKRFDDAEKCYLKAAELDTKNSDAAYWLGMIYVVKNNPDAARMQYEKLKSFDAPRAEKLAAYLPK